MIPQSHLHSQYVIPFIFPYFFIHSFTISNDGVVYGYAIAADTGGFVKKGYFTCDLYMNSTEQCYQWGDRGVTIYVL